MRQLSRRIGKHMVMSSMYNNFISLCTGSYFWQFKFRHKKIPQKTEVKFSVICHSVLSCRGTWSDCILTLHIYFYGGFSLQAVTFLILPNVAWSNLESPVRRIAWSCTPFLKLSLTRAHHFSLLTLKQIDILDLKTHEVSKKLKPESTESLGEQQLD